MVLCHGRLFSFLFFSFKNRVSKQVDFYLRKICLTVLKIIKNLNIFSAPRNKPTFYAKYNFFVVLEWNMSWAMIFTHLNFTCSKSFSLHLKHRYICWFIKQPASLSTIFCLFKWCKILRSFFYYNVIYLFCGGDIIRNMSLVRSHHPRVINSLAVGRSGGKSICF